MIFNYFFQMSTSEFSYSTSEISISCLSRKYDRITQVIYQKVYIVIMMYILTTIFYSSLAEINGISS